MTRRWNLQRVKDAEVLKCWRRRMRGLQQDSIWKSVPEHLRPGTAHYTMANEPHGTGDATKKERTFVIFKSKFTRQYLTNTVVFQIQDNCKTFLDRDRRLPQRKNVMFDSVPESDHDRAVDQV